MMQDGGMRNAGDARHILEPQTRRPFGRHASFCGVQDQDTRLFRLTADPFFFFYQVVTSY
jgi:hypothetical protein